MCWTSKVVYPPVPIYDGSKGTIDWDNFQFMPRVSDDLALDTPVLVAHTTSIYGENAVSLNVQFAVKLA